MRYSVVVEPVEDLENMPGWFYAHVPSLGVTTHGEGIEGALGAARDLIHLWVDEKKAAGESIAPTRESVLATVEVD
ncbi:MAG TPA: type II toxin-antitoxin system HicB family antitoxin [Chthoniobacteraceae bacterium]|jgi:predicted RNase H-like HicB family nuclease|nr:type II toxin-antitoxin system HicB family antitoxin [Chthoniobacteraceae bacterium]